MEQGDNTFVIDPSILLDDIVDEFELEMADIGFDEKEF